MIRTYDDYRVHVEHALIPMLSSLGDIPDMLMKASYQSPTDPILHVWKKGSKFYLTDPLRYSQRMCT